MKNLVAEELARKSNNGIKWMEYFVQLLNGDEIIEVGIRKVMIGGNERVVERW